ncbi:MAG TPA: MFS transporter [Crocinitomix sp.]|nr:MFS transporter [Crocinitomix sp.]
MEKGNKKIIRAWTFYDWANSVYPLVITTSIFPIFYAAMIEQVGTGPNKNMVEFWGYQLSGTVLFSYVVSASFIVVSALSPILSGVADYTGNKKIFLRFFCYLGAFATASLYFFDPHHLEWSMFSLFLASIGFWNSLVFYNAYLPEIAEPKDHDKISAQGFSMGYIGATLLLIVCLLLLNSFNTFEAPIIQPKTVFLIVAIWWIGFSHITYFYLPKEISKHKITKDILVKGYKEIGSVWQIIKGYTRLKRYLYAFFIISMGVQTVMTMAIVFAEDVVFNNVSDKSGLIIAVVIIQFIAIPGAFLFNKTSNKIGNISTLIGASIIWALACVFAYLYVKTPLMFYVLAGVVGFVMGGTQALARSTYSKLLPDTEDTVSFFSFYDVTEKIGMVVGVFLFGFVEDITGDITTSILFLVVVFVLATALLLIVPKENNAG